MNIKLQSHKYRCENGENLATLEINFIEKIYEIHRRNIKSKLFIKEIDKFAKNLLTLNK